MYNLKAHKYILSFHWLESKENSIIDRISSTCNQFCKTQTSRQVDSFFWNLFKCILKMWFWTLL